MEVIYSYAERALRVANPTNEDVTAIFRIMKANVYRKEDTIIISTTQNLVPGTDYEGVDLQYEEVRNVAKYRMHIYDERTETISTATAADIVAFKDTGSLCSEIVIYDRYGDPFDMYLFKQQ